LKILFFANTDWYLYNFRRSLALALRDAGHEVVLVSPPGPYGEKLQALGFRWIPFAFSTCSTNPFREVSVLTRLVALYRRERPSLVHHFTIKCVLYGSLAARFSGVKRVVSAVTGMGHIFIDQGLKARALRPLVRWFYRFSLGGANSRVIFQNQDDCDTFAAAGMVKHARMHVIRGSGVDCARFYPVDVRTNNRVPKVLFASRLLREKGVFELLDAIRLLRTRGVNAEFLLAGNLYPENPSSLTGKELEEVRNEGLISYLGHIEDMPGLLSRCDIVVLPSYQEGTPRILIEAAAAEKPIVATDIAGCRGLVRHGINGLLVPVKDCARLSASLERLILDEQLRRDFGKAGRRIVLEQFDEKIVIAETLAVYDSLIREA
jgi:glycosyltransferase involved in cell wall biosynthesis